MSIDAVSSFRIVGLWVVVTDAVFYFLKGGRWVMTTDALVYFLKVVAANRNNPNAMLCCIYTTVM